MSIYRKIIAVLASIAITFSFVIAPAHAVVDLFAPFTKVLVEPFSDFIVDIYHAEDKIRDAVKDIHRENFIEAIDFWSSFFGLDASGSYEDYVSTLNSTVVTFADAGFSPGFHWAGYEAGTLSTNFMNALEVTSYESGNPFSVTLRKISSSSAAFKPSIYSDTFRVSASGTYFVDAAFTYMAPGGGDSTHYSQFYPQILLNGSWSNLHYSMTFEDSTADYNGFSHTMRSACHTYRLDSSCTYRLVFEFYCPRYSNFAGVNIPYSLSATVRPESQVSVPASSTRPASLMQIINNYNTDNSYTDNSETVNYFIGTVDAGGDVTNIYNVNLYDEETLIFTEPVTGAQYQTTGWTYDYTTRTYQLSLSPGTFQISGTEIDRIDLTYGDDELTLSYYSDGSCVKMDSYAYVRAAESECALNGHTYTYETVKEATCTTPGERKYTCSVCGNQYAEDVPALGHDWNMTESTENTYALPPGTACPDCGGSDFQSSLDKSAGTYTCTCSACGRKWKAEADITIGHSTYTCSRCGETRTETADSESGLFASIGNFIANGISWVTDKLSDLINSLSGINDIFSGFVESIQEKAGDYPAFLGAVIACLPEDLTTVIWFAVIAAIVLAVWKKWFH